MGDIKETVGRVIQAERKRKGLTQEELAEIIDSSSGHISEIERGLVDAGITILTNMCCALDISLNELVQGQRLSNGIPMSMNEKMRKLTDDQIDIVYLLIEGFVSQKY